MARRKIIKIDERKCNGCGLCIPNCPEGALRIIDGKARIISDLFCDGLGACIGHCPEGAIEIEEREAEKYDEKKVMPDIVKQGSNVIKAHLEHLKDHGESGYMQEALEYLRENKIAVPGIDGGHGHHAGGCPGSGVMDLREDHRSEPKNAEAADQLSQLRQWPVQITLVPPNAPYFKGADLLFAADCVPFAYSNFHNRLLKGKILLMGCPKLDNVEPYIEKITSIIKDNDIHSITCAYMEVPCCFGMVNMLETAISASGKNIPLEKILVGIKGEILK